ncbi:MAG: SDR family oxidoreductase [Candidatus Dormibacteraeota bacterium]|nr:SDR family oxidoreductase [Candidatus Dormibacteraeota bacterium]MBV9524762.1 SDR family oxidoreductase [Candidatus Dormibacteraeota bacterium]
MSWSPRRVLITGGAGFIGSHLADRMLGMDVEVICVDNLLTGRAANVAHVGGGAGFTMLRADVTAPLAVEGPLDAVLHLASPASPVEYLRHPLATLDAGTVGTAHALRLAQEKGARFLLASTSEVYGDPLVHPQPETYWGNVNPVGPRSVYDESKRAAEAYTAAYQRARGTDVRIARIFNTYGPRMRFDDGRAIPQFMTQALSGEPITVHGDGSQTRSLCYVDDLIEAMTRLLMSDYAKPVNIGAQHEVSMLELAERVRDVCHSSSPVVTGPLPEDDPKRRCPDISVAREVLGWEPKVSLREGLTRTAEWWRTALADAGRGDLAGQRALR